MKEPRVRNAEESALRPRARLLQILGEELISSEVVAIIELVKNAYDADAQRVLIRFTAPLEPNEGCIEIMDSGTGMDIKTVRSAWLEPATYSKKRKTRSAIYDRRVLGEKGIGRFATSRLAKELELVSRTRATPGEVYGFFDWTQFDDEHLYLDQVLLLTEERLPEDICPEGSIRDVWWLPEELPSELDLSQGTILRMNGLKKSWVDRDFKDLQRGLSRLISPFAKRPNFRICLDLPAAVSEHAKEVVPSAIVNYPHYKVKGHIRGDGEYDLSIHINSDGAEHHETGQFMAEGVSEEGFRPVSRKSQDRTQIRPLEKRRTPECGPFDIELRIWDRDELGNIVDQVDSTLRNVRGDLDALSGINIYRDGFRVLPYGEPKDDWLRLDHRRVQNPTLRLSNNQIVGYVSISADGNPGLKDQSNREGLDENQAKKDLRGTVISILSLLEPRRRIARKRAKKDDSASAKGLFSKKVDLRPLRAYMERRYPEDKKALRLIKTAEGEADAHLKEMQQTVSRYHRLATLGQLIDMVLHESRQPLDKIGKEALFGHKDIEKNEQGNGKLLIKLKQRLGKIRNQGNVLAAVFRRIEPFGGRRRGRPREFAVEKVIKDATEMFSNELDRLNVDMTPPDTETMVRVDEAEIQEIIVNLLQNSLHWIQEADESNRRIRFDVRRIAEGVEIICADSGPGVNPEYRELIFEPYFSTKPNGVGLGLSIAGEIATDFYDGSLELVDGAPLRGAAFRVTLKKRI